MSRDGSPFIGDVLHCLTEFDLSRYSGIAVLLDTNTNMLCWPRIQDHLPHSTTVLVLESGEQTKSLENARMIWDTLLHHHHGRDSLLVNLGGGVITDLGGFVAANYKRGIDCIHIPTTLLAQIDAAIGGKNGINLSGYKNMIGSIRPPKQIWVDPIWWATLPEVEWRSGVVEMIKHGLIAGGSHWSEIEGSALSRTDIDLNMIRESIQIKQAIVDKDPEELGMRRILNLGHTAGHAVEHVFLASKRAITHGQAVAFGLMVAAYLSMSYCGLSDVSYKTICAKVQPYSIASVTKSDVDQIIAAMAQDKKSRGRQIKWSLLRNIGDICMDVSVQDQDMLEALTYVIQQVQTEQ